MMQFHYTKGYDYLKRADLTVRLAHLKLGPGMCSLDKMSYIFIKADEWTEKLPTGKTFKTFYRLQMPR
jgi:hypothetical protein